MGSEVSAWTDEQNIFENETMEYCINVHFNVSTIDNPYIYDMNIENFLIDPSVRSNDPVTFCIEYRIYKYVWDGSSYVTDPDCYYNIEQCIDFIYKIDNAGNGYFDYPAHEEATDGYLVHRYFQDMLNAGHLNCVEYNNTDEVDKPDIFYIQADCDVGNDDLNQVFSGAMKLDSNGENKLKNEEHDYGFSLEGLGAGGGDDIFSDVGWGSGVSEAGNETRKVFYLIFYGVLPLLFVLAVFKMMNRVNR